MTNPYLDMLQAAPAAAPGGEPPANPYLDMLQSADEQRRQQMAGQLTQAVGVNPEQYTAQRRVAQYLGYPTPVVEAQPHLMGQAKVRQIQQDTANAPVLQRKYTDADFAKLAHDDAPILSKIETAVSSAVRYAMGADQYGGMWGDLKRGAWDNSVIGTAGAFRMVSELGASAAELVPAVRSLEASGQYGGNPLRRLAEGFAMIGANQQALKDASSPPAEGNIAGGVSSGFQSAGQNLKYLPLAFLGPAGWAAGLTGMVVESGGTTYQKDREEGVPMGTATIHAAADGLAEYVGERYFGEVGFLKRLAAGAPATKLLMWEITRDVPGEIGTTLWQNFNDWALTNPSKTADQFLREQPDAIVQTAIGALVGGGVQVGVGKLAMRTAETVLNRQMEVTETLQREESLKALMQLAGQAKLAERSPEQLQAFVAEASGDATVRFDAATLVDVFKQDANALAQALPSVDLQALQEAAATGGEVTVPLAELVVGVKAAGVDQTVLEHARLGDSALSAAEAREVQGTLAQSLQQETERVIAQAQDQAAARASHDAVRDNIKAQVVATGRVRDAVAEGYATFAASFFTAYGSRMGMTAEQFYAAYPLRVLGAPSAGQQGGLNQMPAPSVLNEPRNPTPEEMQASGRAESVPLNQAVSFQQRRDWAKFDRRESPGDVVAGFGDKPVAVRLETGEYVIIDGNHRVDRAMQGGATALDMHVIDAKAYDPQNAGRKPAKRDNSGDDALLAALLGQGQSAPRGTYNPQTLELVLNQSTNLSTFFHESGHFFLEVLADIASQPNAPAQIVEDMNTFLKWAGITGDESVGGPDAGGELAQADDRDTVYKEIAADEEVVEALEAWMVDGAPPNKPVNDKLLAYMRRLPPVPSDSYLTFYRGQPRGVSPHPRGWASWTTNKDETRFFTEGNGEVLTRKGVRGISLEEVALWRTRATGQLHDYGSQGEWLVLNESVFNQDGPTAPTQPITPRRTPLETWNAMTLDQKRPYHERWAESVEQYVMEGRAPSVELQPLMRRFAAWLKSVYGSIKQFLASRGQVQAGGEVLGQAARPVAAEAVPTGATSPVTRKPIMELRDANGQRIGLTHSFDTPEEALQTFNAPKPVSAAPAPTYTLPEPAPREKRATNWKLVRGQKFTNLDEDDGFLYHVTTHKNALDINKEGLVPNNGRMFGDAYAGHSANRVFLTERSGVSFWMEKVEQWVQHNSDRPPAVAVVRIPKDKINATLQPDPLGSTDARAPAYFVEGQVLRQEDGKFRPNAGPPMALNDDIRRVMDRMLATDEQIAQANEVAGLVPDEAADGEAAERLRKRSIADLKWAVKARDKALAKLRKAAKGIEKEVRAQVTEEVNQRPEVQAKDALDKLRADKALDDASMAATADAFGFESPDAMLKAIAAFGSKAEAIDGMTEQRMLEEHGDLVDERAIAAAANEAVHNEARARSLATELRTQSEMLNARADTGQTNAKGSRVTVNVLMEAAKQFGANVAQRTPLADVRAAVWRHTQAERRAAKRWQEATAAGKTEEAVKAKQDQTLQHAAARALIEAQDEVRKTLDFFKRVATGNDETVVKKGRDADIVNAARAVLAAYGVETPTTKRADDYLDVIKQNDPETYAAIAPMVDEATRNAQPLRALTVGELQALSEQIGALWYLAKRSRQMEIGGDLLDIDDLATQLNGRMEEIGIPDTVPGEAQAVTKREARALFIRQGLSFLKRVEQWAEGMDGRYGGPFLRYVFQPIKAAADAYRADRTAYRKKLEALVSNLAPIVGDKTIDAPELGYTFGGPDSTKGVAMNEVLHALLHTGNESNKRKLLLGRQWAAENADGTLDTSRWDSFIQRLVATGKLQREHFDFVQGVWDLLEETKPLAQKAHRDAFGRYFAEVTAAPFVDPFGVPRKGGYVPAMVDPALVKDNALRKIAEAENESMSYAFPQPGKGFTMSRVEGYNRALMLDLRTIGQHLDKVLLFSHMTVPARSVRRLVTHKAVSQPLDRIDPTALEVMLQPWLQRSAQQVVETPIPGSGGWARVPSIIRARAGMALMFANVSNAIQQATGLSTAMVKVKPGFIMRAMAQHVAHPVKAAAAVWEASSYMNDRAKNEVAVLNENMRDILLDPSPYEKAQAWSQRHAYFLQTAIDNALSPIVWTGAYNQAMADGMTHDDAVAFADGTVRQTQGSTLPEDVSRFETGPAYARAFTQFIGYFNMVANTNVVAIKQIAGEMGLKRGAGRLFSVVMLGMMIPIWAAEAIAQAFKGGPDDEDKDGLIVDDWLAAVFGFGTAKGLLAMVPIVGQAANSAVTRLDNNPMNDRISLSPGLSLIESAAGGNVQTVAELFNPDKGVNARRAVRDAASLVSIATGLPLYAIARPAGYAAGVAQGKIEPTGPVDAARGLITGTPSPESKVR